VGPHPVIRPVDRHLIPTVQVAVAKGWPAGGKPTAAAGIAVTPFATGLNHPRWLYVLPNGDVLVAETNTPSKPGEVKSREHASGNRKPPVGYKVVFVPFANGTPSGMPVDVLTGFVNEHGEAYGRPLGVAIDAHGALLVADDVGKAVWRATGAAR